MYITKNGKEYSVTEYRDKWTVKSDSGKLSVAFDVSKNICKTSEELREYVLKNDLFEGVIICASANKPHRKDTRRNTKSSLRLIALLQPSKIL